MSATTIHDRYSDDQIASFYASGFWQRSSLTDLIRAQAQERPDQVFVFDSTTQLTFAELYEGALRLAAGFRDQGIGPGDRVAVQLPNWSEFVLVVAALSRVGAIAVPIMPIYRGDEVAYVVRHSGAKAAVTCGEFRNFNHLEMFRGIRDRNPELKALFVARQASDGDVRSLDDLAADGDLGELEVLAGPDTSPDEPFLIVYTSGSTARPKGCFHTFNTLRASSAAIAKSLDYGPGDVQFGPSPVTHSTGMVTSVVLPLLVGAKSHLMEVWDPKDAFRRIKEYGITGAVTATPFLQMLMSAYDPDEHDASSLRFWICAGSPIPGAVVTASRELFAGCQTLSLYGRSENFLTTMCTLDDPPERSMTSDGRAVAGAEAAIVDATGELVAPGVDGDICYRGPSHMIGYYNNQAETDALFTPDGFSRSGDLGRMDADGFVRVTGRIKDIVIRGGMNVSARELEEHLLEHPAIQDVAIVGMPDERLGEKVCVYVVPRAGRSVELADVTSYLRAREVATPKLPERLILLDALPMTATGKVQKHVLRTQVAAALESERSTSLPGALT